MKSGTLILPLVLGAILCTGAERGSLKVQYPGKVADCQGVCSLRARSQDRWDEAIAQWRHVARIRALEPTGFLKLAEAQLHQSHWREAAGTLSTVLARSWPERFGDVQSTARELMRRILPEFQKN